METNFEFAHFNILKNFLTQLTIRQYITIPQDDSARDI